jgi:glycerophosphoryl diester phosphodiesterase
LLQFGSYPTVENNNVWLRNDDELPLVIAHGGSKILYPENTDIAFQKSVELGVDVLEIDIQLTRDNLLVTHHDETIDRMSDGSGYVRNMTFEELSQFNYGYNFQTIYQDFPYQEEKANIMLLEEVFSLYKEQVLFLVEIKNQGEDGKLAAEQLQKLIYLHGLEDKVMVSSFHDDVIDYFLQITNYIVPVSGARGHITDLVLSSYAGLNFFYYPYINGIAVPLSEPFKGYDVPLDTSILIDKLHKHNIFVHYWTINDEDEMRRLIEMGVDGIITDRPDLLLKILDEQES